MRTVWRLFRIAFRMRVSMSPIGSVIVMTQFLLQLPSWLRSFQGGAPMRARAGTEAGPHRSLPARLLHTGDQPLGRELSEAAPADLELPVVAPIAPAEEAPVVGAGRERVLLQRLRDRLALPPELSHLVEPRALHPRTSTRHVCYAPS